MIGCFFLSVGITGLEPATSRPPEATQLALNPFDNQLFSFKSDPLGDGFRDGLHHVGLNFNISILTLIHLESVSEILQMRLIIVALQECAQWSYHPKR